MVGVEDSSNTNRYLSIGKHLKTTISLGYTYCFPTLPLFTSLKHNFGQMLRVRGRLFKNYTEDVWGEPEPHYIALPVEPFQCLFHV